MVVVRVVHAARVLRQAFAQRDRLLFAQRLEHGGVVAEVVLQRRVVQVVRMEVSSVSGVQSLAECVHDPNLQGQKRARDRRRSKESTKGTHRIRVLQSVGEVLVAVLVCEVFGTKIRMGYTHSGVSCGGFDRTSGRGEDLSFSD